MEPSVSETSARQERQKLDRWENLFRQTVGDKKELGRKAFGEIFNSKNPFFNERAFQIFDKDNSGSISMREFLEAMHQFTSQNTDDKIKFLFKVYDLDGDGLIQPWELQQVLKACMEENGMQFSDKQLSDLTLVLFEDADINKEGAIKYESLKMQLQKHDGLLENLAISIDRWLCQPKHQEASSPMFKKVLPMKPYQSTISFVKNNHAFVIFFIAYILVNGILFTTRSYEYRKANWFTIFARACGQCLNFGCVFILVVMLRRSITFLRTRGFNAILPLDQHIYFHKLTGTLILVFGLTHTIMHVCNFSLVIVYDPVINKNNYTFSEWLFTPKPGLFGLIGGWANPTGVVLIIILLLMVICSQEFVRRGGCFEIFYWTHLMYVPFWILLIIHGPNFWKWFLIPGIIFLIEKTTRFYRVQYSSERGRTYISSGLVLPSRVTHLVIKRPQFFNFRSGDYVFVNIPSIAKFEWHPFTISSAPEQDDYIWLHIRGVGEWTNSLYEYFEREQRKLEYGSEALPATPTLMRKLRASLHKKFNRLSGKHSQNQLDGSSNEMFYADDFENYLIPNEMTTSWGVAGRQAATVSEATTRENSLRSEKSLDDNFALPRLRKKRINMRPDVSTDFMRNERAKSLYLAYQNPRHKSIAQNYRYMRNKPTIIAFQPPKAKNRANKNQNDPHQLAEEGSMNVSSKPTAQGGLGEYPEVKPLEIFLDGPYGAPASRIFMAKHAVLIATGIGVTPFASILQSIMHRYWKARHTCPNCQFSWSSHMPETVMKLRKVDFFWINRDQRSFEWFVHLLSQLEIEQAEKGSALERFLEMHMYITSALQKTDMKAVGLQLALDLLHEKEKRCLITGLKTRTKSGRPNWDVVFKQIADQKKGKVTVFYCGPAQLAETLRVKANIYGFKFKKEEF